MSTDNQTLFLESEVGDEVVGKRLDQALAFLFPKYSRSRLKKWIEEEVVAVNGEIKRPRDKVNLADKITITTAAEKNHYEWIAEKKPLDICYEDDHLLVINKSANWVTHPGAGNWTGTVMNALLYHAPQLAEIPRAGVVHRLDKDTTGLMVVAKSLIAHAHLVKQLQARTVKRTYETIVGGRVIAGGTVDAPIGRHPQERVRMAVLESGKTAISHYRVLERFEAYSHLRVDLETGRTHQIRVHMAHIRYPVVGDKVYGGRLRLPPNSTEVFREALKNFPRQALHAKALTLVHPISGEEMSFEVPIPEDMEGLLKILRK